MTHAHSLSRRYIDALRQLPQYAAVTQNNHGYIVHALTGACVSPLGDLSDPDDDTELLQVEFAGGREVQVLASQFFGLALAEAVQLEAMTAPLDVYRERDLTPLQVRASQLGEHLRAKHGL